MRVIVRNGDLEGEGSNVFKLTIKEDKPASYQQQGDEILKVFTNIIGARDEYTQGHSHHVYVIVETLAKILSDRYRLDVPKLMNAALLHDIGKILVPDHILNKEGSLSDGEWKTMRQHPAEGKKLLEGTVFDELSDWIPMETVGCVILNFSNITQAQSSPQEIISMICNRVGSPNAFNTVA